MALVKKTFLGIFWITFSYSVQSQSVKWSMPLSDDRKLPYLKILGAGDSEKSGGYYLLRSNVAFTNEKKTKSRKYELQYYTNDLALKWSQPLTAHLSESG